MKILHLLDERWDSGLTHYAVQIAGLLQQDGHEVALGVFPGKKPEKLARAAGIRTAPIESIPQILKLVRGENWDVINVHTGRSHTWSLLLAPSRVPLVRTRGDARPVHANPASRFVYRKTSAVIAASAHIASYYEEDFQLAEERLSVVYPSVTPDADPTEVKVERIGILGRLDPVKGHAHFLEAAAHVLTERPAAKFVIAGKEANTNVSLLQNQAKELGIEGAVEYVGFQASALEFMRTCSVGVIASVGSEEISRACLEWMSVARPVVGTLVGCLPELIEPGETGLLVPPGDGIALGEALLKILREPGRSQSWGVNAHRLVQQKFSPQVELAKTLDVYRRAQSGR